MNYLMPLIGYIGMALLLCSYMLSYQTLLRAQWCGTFCLTIYSIWRADPVFTALEVACILLITVHLSRGTN